MNSQNTFDDPLTTGSLEHDGIRLRYLCEINPESVTGEFNDSDEIEYVEISSVDSRGQITSTETVNFGDAPSRAKRTAKSGDIIISTVRTYLKAIALLESPKSNLVVSSGFAVLRPTERVISEYLWYVLQSDPYINWIVANSEGVSYPAISTSRLADIIIPVPPITVQKRICEYLRPKLEQVNATIDNLSNKKRNLVEYLKQKQRHLVLGGNISCSERKKSNIGWINEIPSHWEVVRTRFVAELHSGHTPDRSKDEYWVDTDIPWVTTSDIKPFRQGRKKYIHQTENEISEIGMENSGAHLLPENTVFLSRTASVGFSGIMGKPMATSQDFANWVCGDDIIPKYLLYVFRSMDQEFDRLMQGSTHKTIYMPDIKSLKTPLPPIEEQKEIVEDIETEANRLWNLIDCVEETIDLLEKKRQALITGAITNQIDNPQSLDEDKTL